MIFYTKGEDIRISNNHILFLKNKTEKIGIFFEIKQYDITLSGKSPRALEVARTP
jgi:hypothetical protein